ncbi:MAG: hypothetical protein V1927_01135 [Candidatus Omnitrophota bacterium]
MSVQELMARPEDITAREEAAKRFADSIAAIGEGSLDPAKRDEMVKKILEQNGMRCKQSVGLKIT